MSADDHGWRREPRDWDDALGLTEDYIRRTGRFAHPVVGEDGRLALWVSSLRENDPLARFNRWRGLPTPDRSGVLQGSTMEQRLDAICRRLSWRWVAYRTDDRTTWTGKVEDQSGRVLVQVDGVPEGRRARRRVVAALFEQVAEHEEPQRKPAEEFANWPEAVGRACELIEATAEYHHPYRIDASRFGVVRDRADGPPSAWLDRLRATLR
jgi:hypothetical protein